VRTAYSFVQILVLMAAATASCAAAPSRPENGPPPRANVAPTSAPGRLPAGASAARAAREASPTATASAAPVPSAAPSAAADAAPSATPSSVPAPGPAACPADMKLVEGDYCTNVEHKCLIDWFAPQNNKVVCEQFAPSSKCVGKRVHKRYCIDTYEWPNQKGTRPEVMNHFYQAQVKCAAAGKRMCGESEWNFACEGPQMKPFPHGYTRDPSKCNGDQEWDGPNMDKVRERDAKELARLWKGVPSGSQPECISDFGVADMPGNADEVVAGESPKAKFASVNTGGPWYSGVRNQCRPKVYTHEEGFYYYYLSFRCCSEPDGKPNEPRTQKQIKDGMKWATIERLAQFTVEQMREKLAQKKQGQCTCAPSDVLCKTMCGRSQRRHRRDSLSQSRPQEDPAVASTSRGGRLRACRPERSRPATAAMLAW
jgi:sulfatase modifying factor 1